VYHCTVLCTWKLTLLSRRQGVVLALEKRPVKGGKLRSYVKVLWNTSSVPCYHASHALLLLKEREDAIEEASKLIAN
jgi:hypothetical protein